MTAPNIRTAATITAGNAALAVGTTYSALVSNASTSSAVTKVSCIHICNLTSATSCAVTLAISDGTSYHRLLAGQAITASIQPVTRTTPVYLEEGDSICIYAATSGYLEAVVTYEILK